MLLGGGKVFLIECIFCGCLFPVNVHYVAAAPRGAAAPASQSELFFDIQYLYLFHIGVTCGAAGGASG